MGHVIVQPNWDVNVSKYPHHDVLCLLKFKIGLLQNNMFYKV